MSFGHKLKIVLFVVIYMYLYVFMMAKLQKDYKNGLSEQNIRYTNMAVILLFGILYCKISSSTEGFFFELTPEKKCRGGPYMHQSDTELQKYCASLSPAQYSKYNCPGMFNGEPTAIQFTPLSNENWQNENQCQ